IVIAIIAILAAVLVPNFMRAREASRLTACKSNLKNISTAVETYSNDYDGLYPGNSTTLTEIKSGAANGIGTLQDQYISKTLLCPAAAQRYQYALSNASGTGYWIYCPAAQGAQNQASRKHRKNNQQGGPVLDSAIGIIEKFQ
ncbi:MAG: DUF1559 domain-containing protein, partial [bacterium]